jgi:hypothetical protein
MTVKTVIVLDQRHFCIEETHFRKEKYKSLGLEMFSAVDEDAIRRDGDHGMVAEADHRVHLLDSTTPAENFVSQSLRTADDNMKPQTSTFILTHRYLSLVAPALQ